MNSKSSDPLPQRSNASTSHRHYWRQVRHEEGYAPEGSVGEMKGKLQRFAAHAHQEVQRMIFFTVECPIDGLLHALN